MSITQKWLENCGDRQLVNFLLFVWLDRAAVQEFWDGYDRGYSLETAPSKGIVCLPFSNPAAGHYSLYAIGRFLQSWQNL
ncbi:hypothetical protein C7B65_22355 [Phormidesmis priestleyi ULC007]|uniref:Uncharacterized protein n=1 Tax=Phormidesmis priestleyi ULC007 TaxID=1920490 RepID=A0A2T1D6M8_9CYAN|nr:hypothetical protein C7B65_22355 [Phormidesmis priestleyi ULC007]PZO46914.1 MAG: hypothetical protein DCF14_21235 [Phormidesmis priestleyi]